MDGKREDSMPSAWGGRWLRKEKRRVRNYVWEGEGQFKWGSSKRRTEDTICHLEK